MEWKDDFIKQQQLALAVANCCLGGSINHACTNAGISFAFLVQEIASH
jgi:hypothetical protein